LLPIIGRSLPQYVRICPEKVGNFGDLHSKTFV
jgi:hypothetical protein